VNKLLLILLFFFCSNARAQDSIAVKEPQKGGKSIFTEKDIFVDNDTIILKTFDKNFKKKYKDAAFVYEYKTPEKNAWDRFKQWLANIVKNIFGFTNVGASMVFLYYLFRIIAVIVVCFVVYLIVKAILNKEGKWLFGKNSSKKIINYTEIEKNLHLIDFEKLIAQTLQSGEKRLSIRYYYLWLLKKMAAKDIIVWDLEKTNSDYLYEIKSETTRDEFAYLSYLYNYIWYGEFELDDETFNKAKNAFEKAIKSLGNV
jgi:hypothetical protein